MSRGTGKKRAIAISPVGILTAPIRANGQSRTRCAFELGMHQTATKAIGGCMRSAKQFIVECLRHGILEVPNIEDDHEYALYIPKDWDEEEWMAMYEAHGPPPWRGERDGLVPLDRWKMHYNGRRGRI